VRGVRLSVLIVTFNRPNDLLDLLQSMARQEHVDDALEEVLILDNGTTADYADTWKFADAHPDLRVRVIRSEENLGAPAGKNVLMREARGEVFLFLDDDIVLPAQHDLRKLTNVFDAEFFRDADAGLVQVRVAYYDTKEIQKSAYPHKRRIPDSEDGPFLTSFFAGGATLIRREAVEKAGLYPEDFFYGMEEYDLSYRLIEAGYSIGYDPSITIEHKESPSGRLGDHVKLRRQWVNKSVVAWRYLPRRYALTTAVMWSIEYVRRVKGHPLTYLRAWWDVLKIPFTVRRTPIGRQASTYLRSVRARLWY
jgi:GT2 family glycosyltransferase